MSALGKDYNGASVPFKTVDDAGEIVPVFEMQGDALSALQAINNKTPSLSGGEIPVVDASNAALQASINMLNETMLVYLSAIFEKMPRLQANDRVMCDLSETSLATITTLTTLTTANDLLRLQGLGSSTINVTKAADAIPVHLSNVGALHLYDKILVS